jgi:hypothetical protein
VLIGTAMQQEQIRHRQEQNGCRQEENKTAKTLLLPGTARLKCGVHVQMRRRQYIHMFNFVYEDDIKVKDK